MSTQNLFHYHGIFNSEFVVYSKGIICEEDSNLFLLIL